MADLNIFTLLLRVGLSLGVVFGLMWGAARLLGKGGLGTSLRSRHAPIEVVARQSLGRRSSIALVRTAGRGLVLGVTDGHVTLLAETDADALLPEPARTPNSDGEPERSLDLSAWKNVLDVVRDKTVRRA